VGLFQMFQYVPMDFRALEQVFYFKNQLLVRFCSNVPKKLGVYAYVCARVQACACVRIRARNMYILMEHWNKVEILNKYQLVSVFQ
jgi:hypothetical protein